MIQLLTGCSRYESIDLVVVVVVVVDVTTSLSHKLSAAYVDSDTLATRHLGHFPLSYQLD